MPEKPGNTSGCQLYLTRFFYEKLLQNLALFSEKIESSHSLAGSIRLHSICLWLSNGQTVKSVFLMLQLECWQTNAISTSPIITPGDVDDSTKQIFKWSDISLAGRCQVNKYSSTCFLMGCGDYNSQEIIQRMSAINSIQLIAMCC